MKSAWINGSFEATVSPHDEGFLLGHGVFETIGVFDGNLPLWQAHLRRLGQGAAALGIPFDPPNDLVTSRRCNKHISSGIKGDFGIAADITWGQ